MEPTRRTILTMTGLTVMGLAGTARAAPVRAAGTDLPQAIAGEAVTYLSGEHTIRAAVYRPVGAGRAAGVVFMHGSGGVGPAYLHLAERLARDGYLVIVPAYQDAAADDGIRPEPVMAAWRAAGSDAVDWLIDQGIDRHRVGIMGYSLGSYVAVDGALGDSRAAAAIGVAGGTDVYPPRIPHRRIPVLMIRAERDTHVLPENTRAWVAFLDQHDIPVRVQRLRGAGHILTAAQWTDVSDRASRFFAGNIGRPIQDHQ
jgi:dienelactone hydrolase